MYTVLSDLSFAAPVWAQSSRRVGGESEVEHVFVPSVQAVTDEQAPIRVTAMTVDAVDATAGRVQVLRFDPWVEFSVPDPGSEVMTQVFTVHVDQAKVLLQALTEIVAVLENPDDAPATVSAVPVREVA